MQKKDGDKLTVRGGWCRWAIWRVFRWFYRPKPNTWVRLKNPATAQTLPELPVASLETLGLVIERNGLFTDVIRVQWSDGAICWCYERDLEVESSESQQHTCQHVLDEGEDGERWCGLPVLLRRTLQQMDAAL